MVSSVTARCTYMLGGGHTCGQEAHTHLHALVCGSGMLSRHHKFTGPLAAIDATHIRRQIAWSQEKFGPGMRTKGVIDHIKKELAEIEAEPASLEWIDVIILAFDGAWRAGHEPQDIIDAIIAKQTKNENRTWPDWRTRSEDEAIEHDRSAGDG